MKTRAFTLIELLIVVAIIAILAAIAVPNFMEAQTRARVSRTQSDIRTQAMALESYFVDYGSYTRDSDSSLDTVGQTEGHYNHELANGVLQLTTPIAYMSGILEDPFAKGTQVMAVGGGGTAMGYRIASGSWSYGATGFNDDQGSYAVFKQMGPRQCYAIIGVGPDKARARMGYKCFPFQPANNSAEGPVGVELNTAKNNQPNCWMEYDPTNGSVSVGDIYRFGGDYQSGRFMLNGKIVGSSEPIGGAAF
ncbi:MAG: prepilin-type N-terminal cleavage/methylation domain-containing protein [Candidatus Sumerlaeia bacterium]